MLLKSIVTMAGGHVSLHPKKAKELGLVNDHEGILNHITEQDRLDDTRSRIRDVVNGGLIHSTHLKDICPRQISLLRFTKTEFIHTNGYITTNDRLIWATGRAYEEHIRTQFINAVGKKSVAGLFKCVCGYLRGGKNLKGQDIGELSEKRCPKCGTTQDNYHELAIPVKEYHSTHGPDLPFYNSNGQTVIVEIKSMKKGDPDKKDAASFLHISEPLISNLKQVFMYHRIGVMSGANMAPYVILIYAAKAHMGRKAPYKEFKINVNDPKYRHHYDYNKVLLEKGKVVKAIDENGKVSPEYDCGDGFPERICSVPTCTTAKGCQVAGLCFSIGNDYEKKNG